MAHRSFVLFNICVGLIFIVSANADPFWKDCGAENIVEVKINDCTKSPCIPVLHKESNATIEVKYTAKMNSNTSTSVVHGIIVVPVPFPLPDDNGCHYTSPSCPIVAGTDYTFSTKLFVAKEYPSIKLVVKWEEQADNKADLFCLLVPAEIE